VALPWRVCVALHQEGSREILDRVVDGLHSQSAAEVGQSRLRWDALGDGRD